MSDKSNKDQEFIDQQRELSGSADGALQVRFFDEDGTPRSRQEKERKAKQRERAFEQLIDLMNDPVYRAQWEEVSSKLDEVQAKLNSAIDEVAARIEHLQDLVSDLEDQAPKINGVAVFKSEDGRIFTADGGHLPSEAVPASLLSQLDASPSWEQYRDADHALKKARSRHDDLSDIQTDIDGIGIKLHDPKERPTPEDLDDLGDRIKEIEIRIEDISSSKKAFNQNSQNRSLELESDFELDMKPT